MIFDIAMVKTIYNDISASVSVNGYTTERIQIKLHVPLT